MTAHVLKVAGEHILKEIPLGRYSKPEEIGGLAVFLASPAAAWMTGATIRHHGGQTSAVTSVRHVAKL